MTKTFHPLESPFRPGDETIVQIPRVVLPNRTKQKGKLWIIIEMINKFRYGKFESVGDRKPLVGPWIITKMKERVLNHSRNTYYHLRYLYGRIIAIICDTNTTPDTEYTCSGLQSWNWNYTWRLTIQVQFSHSSAI
jgi:hypothetical protein